VLKLQAADWCGFAHRMNLRLHYARAGTERKVRHAKEIGADSIDPTFPLWTKQRFYRFVRWFSHPSGLPTMLFYADLG
jgi:hypothetical protein